MNNNNNYNKFSKLNNSQKTNRVTDSIASGNKPKAIETAEKKVKEVAAPASHELTTAKGTVANVSLNIRKSPSLNGEILCVVKAGTELVIDLNKSADEWLKVLTPNNISGFCMKEFVEY